MSANIYWRPVKKGHDIPVNAPSSFISKLTEAFGELPLRISGKHLGVLRGLQIGDKNEKEAYEEIEAALEKSEEIEIWAEY